LKCLLVLLCVGFSEDESRHGPPSTLYARAMRVLVGVAVGVGFVLALRFGTACGSSSTASMGLSDAETCFGCDASDALFDIGISALYCEEIDDAGLAVCGEIPNEMAGIECQTVSGQLTTACPTNPIGACADIQGGKSQQWFGNVYYYSLDAGTPPDGGRLPLDAGATVSPQQDCTAQKGTWTTTK
jgi:hypothetical protein